MAKQKVCDKGYDFKTGEITFKFTASGNVLSIAATELPGMTSEIWAELGKNVGTAEDPDMGVAGWAFVHGIHQKVGDSYSSLGDSPDEAEDAATSIIELLRGGDWRAQREKGEARPSLVGRAVFAFKGQEKALKDGETEADYVTKYSGKDAAALRAKALKNPEVAAIVARIKADEAVARATKLADKAKEAKAGAKADAPATSADL